MSIKKIVGSLFRSIEQKSKLDLITELLTSENTTEEALSLFHKTTANFKHEMQLRKEQNEKENRMINGMNIQRKEYNPDYDKKLIDLETDFSEEFKKKML
jgi:hypothetical protein